jgi:enoyl-CoA hydratase
MEKTALPSIETVKFAVAGSVGLITLNRPKALNALDQEMCLTADAALKVWAEDDGITAVIIRGAGDKAFCAGGDVRLAREDGIAWKKGQSEGRIVREFFRDEYRMDRRIATFPKPYIALIDGITMGGGVGISVHGTYRLATARTMLAMPETQIGLFPDVGASYILSRLPGETGTWLALTGARLNGADCRMLGIATHLLDHARLDDLVDALTAPGADIGTVVESHATRVGNAEVLANRATIDRCFAHHRMEDIVTALEADGGAFATETLATLRLMSPTSLKLTLKLVRKARTASLDDCFRMDYRLSQSVLAGHDFYEGVRAQLVDKDRNPKWYPATLDAVDDSAIDSLFVPPLQGDLTFED